MTTATEPAPVLFAYHGSDLAKPVIDEAGRQLAPGRDAIVLTVCPPFTVAFVPAAGFNFDTAQVLEVKHAAQHSVVRGRLAARQRRVPTTAAG
jgi:hypothetical protein